MVKTYFLFLVSTGVLTSPNFPDNYPENLHTIETIKVEEGLIISIKFTAFNIESDPWCDDCACDYLTIVDGDGTTLMGKSCGSPDYLFSIVVAGQDIGTSLPYGVTSKSNMVKVIFRTTTFTSNTTNRSWGVTWSAVTPGVVRFSIFCKSEL